MNNLFLGEVAQYCIICFLNNLEIQHSSKKKNKRF